MRQEIKDRIEALPERQISAGIYVQTVGYKYVTVLNTWGGTRTERIDINEFYRDYM